MLFVDVGNSGGDFVEVDLVVVGRSVVVVVVVVVVVGFEVVLHTEDGGLFPIKAAVDGARW